MCGLDLHCPKACIFFVEPVKTGADVLYIKPHGNFPEASLRRPTEGIEEGQKSADELPVANSMLAVACPCSRRRWHLSARDLARDLSRVRLRELRHDEGYLGQDQARIEALSATILDALLQKYGVT